MEKEEALRKIITVCEWAEEKLVEGSVEAINTTTLHFRFDGYPPFLESFILPSAMAMLEGFSCIKNPYRWPREWEKRDFWAYSEGLRGFVLPKDTFEPNYWYNYLDKPQAVMCRHSFSAFTAKAKQYLASGTSR
jgi:hypothetical protein